MGERVAVRKRQPARRTSCLFVLWCSKPVSRVLSFKTAIYLDAPLLTRSSRLPGTAGPACVSLHGVAPDRVYSDGHFYAPSGELLPRLSILTSSSQATYRSFSCKQENELITLLLLSPQKRRFCGGPIYRERGGISLLHLS